ncbi:MAG: cytochrome c-type biogenesis protein CcmH [Anaerolineales bacterium]|nr:cytochrome c-type biogenesis protein CcmH [Anaerolineales bacterium]
MKNQAFFRWPLALLLLAGLLLASLPALAQEAERAVSDDEVNEVAKEVYCPVCESTPLDVCETQACEDWRELIRAKLAAGESPEQIFTYFAEQYGDRVLATPPARGLNLLLWIWPVVAVLAGGFIFVRYMRGLRAAAAPGAGGKGETAVSTPSVAADDYAARLERELQKK